MSCTFCTSYELKQSYHMRELLIKFYASMDLYMPKQQLLIVFTICYFSSGGTVVNYN